MKVISDVDVTVTLEMTLQEATWLKNFIQNFPITLILTFGKERIYFWEMSVLFHMMIKIVILK